LKKRTNSLKKVSRSWNIPFNSLSNHLNGKIRSKKMGPTSVLTKEKDVTLVAWILGMQECGLSITLQKLKMKVVELA
jgi:hypothetical protein